MKLATPRTGLRRLADGGFSLLEVMIAIGIFFIGACAILDLVSSSLNNVRRLQRESVDAGPVLARYAATNILVEGSWEGKLSEPGLLGNGYEDYTYIVTVSEVASNHLYGVECQIFPAHGKRELLSEMTTILYRPQSPKGLRDGGPGMAGH